MIGLERGRVKLYGHVCEWDIEAERTIAELKTLLGDSVQDIQHVGSTSVPTIMAKPIIDIAVATSSFSAVLEREELLLAHGYYYRPDVAPTRQLLFAKGSFYDGTGKLQTHFIHVVHKDSPEWKNYIIFRDYLKAFPEAAKQYEELKLSLAKAFPHENGREQYLAGKKDFIALTLKKAGEFFKIT